MATERTVAQNAARRILRLLFLAPAVAAALFLFASALPGTVPAAIPVASAQTLASSTPPHITSISPSSGPIGTMVTIYGSGFAATDFINLGPGVGLPDASGTQTATQITFTIPVVLIPQCTLQNPPCAQTGYYPTPGIYQVSLTDLTASSTSNSATFTVTPSTHVTSVTPTQGQIGTNVTIYGYGFSTVGNAINFDMGSAQGVVPQVGGSSTILTFTIPKQLLPRCVVLNPPCSSQLFAPSPGSYSISVAPELNYSENSNQVPFTLNSGSVAVTGPVITSITPASGTIGTQVTVHGSNFSPNANVIDFGTGITVAQLSGSDLTFTIPQTLVPRCTYFGNPPCTTTTTISVSPQTYSIAVATDPTVESNHVPLTVTPIPLPSTIPSIISSSTIGYGAISIAYLHVRTDPSLSASILATEAPSSTGSVIGGPVSADGYIWFDIAWQDGASGWSVANYLVLSSLSPCPVNVGDKVYAVVTGFEQALTLYARSSPSLSSTVVGAENTGAVATVDTGPVTADGFNWWKLTFADGVTGWITDTNFIDTGCIATPTSTAPSPSGAAPLVTFITPQANATVSGQVPVAVGATSNFPITNVQFYENNTLIGTATAPPYTVTWDTASLLSGSYVLRAVANTSAGVSGIASESVNVSGVTYPVVNFTTPTALATVSGQVPVAVSVSSSLPVTEVDFYVDNVLLGKTAAAPYSVTWNAAQAYNGWHTLTAIAHTTNAGITGSGSESVNVTGGIPPPTPPPKQNIEVIFVTPTQGATVSGQVPITVTVSSSVAIAGVKIYADGLLVGSAGAPPYTATWDASQVLNGWHTLYAVATAVSGGYTGGRSESVNVTGGLSYPKVTFTTPLAGATVSGQAPVTVSVAPNNPAVTEVDFYANGISLGNVPAPGPYTVTWNAAQAYNGANSLLAVAHTTKANITGSASESVNVTGGLARPAISVTITAPLNGATVFGNVPIGATVSSTVTIARVDFRANGALIGSAASAPYGVIWDSTTVAPGNYTVTATAFATTGLSAGQSIVVTVIAPPIFHAGEKVQVQTDSSLGLNVRSGPSTSYSVVGTEPNGALGTVLNNIPVVADTYNWWNIQYADGITGWSVETYLVAVP